MGGFEALLSGNVDPSVKYHSLKMYNLTPFGKTEEEQYLVGSFSGALSS